MKFPFTILLHLNLLKIILSVNPQSSSSCNNEFERNLNEKYQHLRREIWSQSRTIEQQISKIQEKIDEEKTEFINFSANLKKQLQIILVSFNYFTTDLIELKTNLTNLKEITTIIKDNLEIQKILASSSSPFEFSSNNNKNFQTNIPKNCQEIDKQKTTTNSSSSGVYLIQPELAEKPFLVFCDMDFDDGGWTILQNRFSGDQEFYQNWSDYKNGFGNLAGEHWLGLQKIYELTDGQTLNRLAIQLTNHNEEITVAKYAHFSIGSEEEGFPIKLLGNFEGSAGDSFSYHAGNKFSTKDRDQDLWHEGNCAQSHYGGWWYKSCDKSNLNGRYLPGNQPPILLYQPMYWDSFGGAQIGLKKSKILIKPIE